MEGIIPFIFKVIAQYKEEAQAASFGGMASDDSVEPSPVSSSYVLLPGDSYGRHRDERNDGRHHCPTSVDSEAVTTCSARPSPLRCSTLRRRA
jgi:hypothetical protein